MADSGLLDAKTLDVFDVIKQLFPSKADEDIRTTLYTLVDDETFRKIMSSPTLDVSERQKALMKLALRANGQAEGTRARLSQSQGLSEPPNSVVELNIGGYHYITTASTLCPHGQETYFTAMLRSGFAKLKDSKGRFFIDRNGRYFAPLLEYLRTGVWRVPPGFDERTLLEEAQFFGIRSQIPLTVSDGMLREAVHERQRALAEESMDDALERYGEALQRIVDITLPQLLAAAREGRSVASPWFFPSRDDILEAAAAVDPALAKRVQAQLPDDFTYDSALHAVSAPTLLAFLKHKHNLTLRVAKKMFVASKWVGGDWDCRRGFLEPEEVQKMDPNLTLRVLAAGWQLQWVLSHDRKNSSHSTL